MYKPRVVCPIKDCGQPSNGKPYCKLHMALGERRKVSKELSMIIRSACCSAKCETGAAHEDGMQYCTKCKQPCIWKA